MMTAFRRFLVLFAGLFGAAGVALAARAAHVDVNENLSTAAEFAMIGAAGMVGCAAFGAASGRGWSFADLAAGLLALGTLLFSGALAVRVLFDATIFPMAAPSGGIMLIAGWLVLALAAFQRARPS